MGWKDVAIPVENEDTTSDKWKSLAVPISDEPAVDGRSEYLKRYEDTRHPETPTLTEIAQQRLREKYPGDYEAKWQDARKIGELAEEALYRGMPQKQDTSGSDFQKGEMLKYARRRLKESPIPNVESTAVGFATSMASPIMRMYDPNKVDVVRRLADAYEQAARERDEGGMLPPAVRRGMRGAVQSAAPMLLAAGTAGPAGAYMMAATQEFDSAITRGRDAGLSGLELGKYAVAQGAIEGGTEALLSRVGLRGLEDLAGGKQAVQAGILNGLKVAGITTAKEVPRELLTELNHSIEDKLSRVDKDAMSLESLGEMAVDTTVQTIFAGGFGSAPTVAKSFQLSKLDRTQQAILSLADSNAPVSRGAWKRLGFDPAAGKTAEDRKNGVKTAADIIRSIESGGAIDSQQAAAEQGAIPFIQEATEVVSQATPEPAPLATEQVTQEVAREAAPEITGGAVVTEQQEIPFVQEATEQLEFAAPDELPSPTSIKNAIVNDLRAKRGEGPIETIEGQSWDQWFEDANQAIVNGGIVPEAIVDELNSNPRNILPVETAALNIHYNRLQSGLRAASARLSESFASGNEAEIERAQGHANRLLGKVRATEEAAHTAGTLAGQSLNARKLMVIEDNSLDGLIVRATIAKGGAAITPIERKEIEDTANKIAMDQAALDKRNEEKELHQLEAGVDAEIIKSRPKKGFRKPSKKILEAQAEAKAAWDDFSAQLAGKSVAGFVAEEKGAMNPQALASAARLARAYINLGTVMFSEFYSHAKAHLGQRAEDARDTLYAAWSGVKEETGPLVDIDPENARAVSRFAKKLTRSIIESGTTEREAVVDLVHEGMSEVIPGITRRQTKEAIAGYGIYTELSKAEAAVIQRDITGQLQQMSKLADMKEGRASKKTGVEHRTMSDAERQLVQQVNEAKRRGGYAVTDPAKQLKTANDAAKTAVKHQIADMTAEIDAKEKIVKQKTPFKPDEELIALRKKRDELRVVYDEMFPKQPLTDTQRAAIAERAIDRAIAVLEEDIKSGDVAPKKRMVKKITSPSLEKKRAKLDSLRQQRDAMRDILNPKLTPEERQLATYKTSLLSRLADVNRRMAEGDFSKKERKHVALDKEATDLKFRLNEEKAKFKQMEKKWQLANATPARKAWYYTANTLNASRAIMTGFDLSAVFRQGGLAVYGHPIKAAINVEKMLRAFVSEKSEFGIMEELRNRPNARLYTTSKLALTTTENQLSKQEEDFMGEWVSKIPGVAASGRAYTTFLNLMRADMFDSMSATLGVNGKVTDMEAKVISSFINSWTGRADLGRAQAAAATLATVFFSPKYVVSRFQVITGRHLWGGNARTRKAIAKEYGRTLIGIGTFLGTVLAMSKLLYPDDEQPTIQTDPRSSDWGQLRWGDKRLDFLSGIGQATVLLSRVVSGKTKRATGEVVSLIGSDIPFGSDDLADATARFLRGKLSPWLGAAIDIRIGRNVVNEPVTPLDVAWKSITPMSFRDIYDAIRDDHIERGAALSLLTILGMATRTYSNATPGDFAEKIARHPKLRGFSKRAKESFDYSDEVAQVVAEAKRIGLTKSEMISDLISKDRKAGVGKGATSKKTSRLNKRFSE